MMHYRRQDALHDAQETANDSGQDVYVFELKSDRFNYWYSSFDPDSPLSDTSAVLGREIVSPE